MEGVMNDTPLRVFIAGPMTTSGEPGPNTHAACTLAGRLLRAGHHPIIPHLSWFAHAIDPETSVEAWMEWGLREVERADAVIRLRGASCGADAECLRAEELGIPIVRIDSIPDDLRLLRELLEEERGDQHQVDEYTTTSRSDLVERRRRRRERIGKNLAFMGSPMVSRLSGINEPGILKSLAEAEAEIADERGEEIEKLRNELRLVKHAKAKLEGELQAANILLAGKEGQA